VSQIQPKRKEENKREEKKKKKKRARTKIQVIRRDPGGAERAHSRSRRGTHAQGPRKQSRSMHVKAVRGPGQFPPRLPKHHLSKKLIATPSVLELVVVLHFSTFPTEPPIINNAKPNLLQKLGPRPLDIIEDSVVMLHP
jgi:hypothetical protein